MTTEQLERANKIITQKGYLEFYKNKLYKAIGDPDYGVKTKALNETIECSSVKMELEGVDNALKEYVKIFEKKLLELDKEFKNL